MYICIYPFCGVPYETIASMGWKTGVKGSHGTRLVVLEGKITKSIESLRDEQVMYIPCIETHTLHIHNVFDNVFANKRKLTVLPVGFGTNKLCHKNRNGCEINGLSMDGRA